MLHSGYSLKQVRECARAICIILNKTTKKKQNKLYKAITEKYRTKKFLSVAEIPARLRQEAKFQQKPSEEPHSAGLQPMKTKRDASDVRMDSEEWRRFKPEMPLLAANVTIVNYKDCWIAFKSLYFA